jgi:hypothetical protein
MINELRRGKEKKLDNRINIEIGQRFIQSKVALEDVGILDKDKFIGKLNMYPSKDKKLLLDEKKKILF